MHRAETIKKHFAPLLPTWSWWWNIKWFLFSSGIIEWVRYEYGERQNLSLLAVILTHTCIWYLNYPEEKKGLPIFLFFLKIKLLLFLFRVLLKKSGSRTPRVELEEMGPSLDFVMRRTHLASDDLMKAATKVPKAVKVIIWTVAVYSDYSCSKSGYKSYPMGKSLSSG